MHADKLIADAEEVTKMSNDLFIAHNSSRPSRSMVRMSSSSWRFSKVIRGKKHQQLHAVFTRPSLPAKLLNMPLQNYVMADAKLNLLDLALKMGWG